MLRTVTFKKLTAGTFKVQVFEDHTQKDSYIIEADKAFKHMSELTAQGYREVRKYGKAYAYQKYIWNEEQINTPND